MVRHRPGGGMLQIRAIIDSCVEEVLAFKTCCGVRACDQNLEFLLTNLGTATLVVPSRCQLLGPWGRQNLDHLMPHGSLRLAPGETRALYCSLDPQKWRQATQVVFEDMEGNTYPCPLEAKA